MKNAIFIPEDCLFDYLADPGNEELSELLSICLSGSLYKLTQSAGGSGNIQICIGKS